MNPLADLTKAPLLYKIGDKTYEVSPLTQRDFGELVRYVQFLDWYIIKDLPNIPVEVVKETFENCLKKRIMFNALDDSRLIETPEGSAETVYHSLKHKHPAITREEVSGWKPGDLFSIAVLALILTMPPTDDTERQKKMLEFIAQLKASNLLQ